MIGSNSECLYSQNFRKRLLNFIRNKPLILKELEEILFNENQELVDNCFESIKSYQTTSKDTEGEISNKLEKRLDSYLGNKPYSYKSETQFDLIVWRNILTYLDEFNSILLNEVNKEFHLSSRNYQSENILKILDTSKEDDGEGYNEAIRLIVTQYLRGKNSKEEILEIFYQLVVDEIKMQLISVPTSNLICFVGYYLRRDKLVGLLTTPQLEQLQREVTNLSDLNFSSLNFCSKETAAEFLEKELKKRKKEEY